MRRKNIIFLLILLGTIFMLIFVLLMESSHSAESTEMIKNEWSVFHIK